MTEKSAARSPGRPKGSSPKGLSDLADLAKVADKIINAPGTTTRAAIVQVLANGNDSDLRRLQRKWKAAEGKPWLEEAQARKDAADRRLRDQQEAARTRHAAEPFFVNAENLAMMRALGHPNPAIEAAVDCINRPSALIDSLSVALDPLKHQRQVLESVFGMNHMLDRILNPSRGIDRLLGIVEFGPKRPY